MVWRECDYSNALLLDADVLSDVRILHKPALLVYPLYSCAAVVDIVYPPISVIKDSFHGHY